MTLALVFFGLVMSFSASFVDAAEAGDPFGVFRRQSLWTVLGLALFALAARLRPATWRRFAWPVLLATLVGLVLVLIPGVGVERFGSTRWLGVGPFLAQPSELAKLAVLLWLADLYERRRTPEGPLPPTDQLLVPAVGVLVVFGGLVLVQPDLGTVVLLALIVGAVLWIEGLRPRVVAWLGAIGVLLVGIAAVTAPYRLARLSGWLAPEDDPLGAGFQLLQARYALGSGGLFGLGLGSSRGKWQFIPNPETDFIFAIIGEELGLIGALATLMTFTALLIVGVGIAYRASDGFARTLAFVITAWIVGQALVNIATVIGLLPITGVTLPLVSVGGSSLIVTLTALGILVAVAREAAESAARPAGGTT